MRCPNCNKELTIQVGTKVNCKNCKILTEIISILTIKCDNCKHIFQVPVKGKSFLKIKKEK